MAKEETSAATVLSRRLECNWVVSFRLDSGEDVELRVTEEQYRDLREGVHVELTRKGNELLHFRELEESALDG